MNGQITQKTREDVAQKLRQWAMTSNVSLAQTEQMVMAVLSGQYDAQLLHARPGAHTSTPLHQQQHQQHTSTNPIPIFGFQTPFGTFPLPTMPPISIPAAPGLYPPPATVVPDMFSTANLQTASLSPPDQSTRTTFPGGEAIQQSSSYSGQQGNVNFQYSSSSTSMNFTPGAQIPTQSVPLSTIQYSQQPGLPAVPSAPPAQTYVAAPARPQLQQPLEIYTQPLMVERLTEQPQTVQSQIVQPQSTHGPIVELIPTPEPIYHPMTADQVPQNARLANKFKQKLTEATYFSDIPGMPDQSVQR